MDIKPLLIETIRIQNGRVRNIKYHNQRCNSSRKALFGSKKKIDLRNAIDTTLAHHNEVKCRITYGEEIIKVEYEPYSIRPIQSLTLTEIEGFDYPHKFADRQKIKELFDQRGKKDDILMTRNGFITDTSYANVALLKNGIWHTPKHPLLKGSCRARLLVENIITATDIHMDQVKEFEAITIFNAMIPFKNIILPINF